MKRFGLIGNPVSHSRSPLLFKEAYPDSDMSYELIGATTLNEAFEVFLKEFDAVNVTSPFKDSAFIKATASDTVAGTLETTNLLKKQDGCIMAYNTDYCAVKSILSPSVSLQNRLSVLVIGCGGAGKAAAMAARDLGCNTTIANRNFEKAQNFCHRIGGAVPLKLSKADSIIKSQDIIIYTLPVALKDIVDADFTGKTVIEANYKDPCLSFISGRFKDSTYVCGKQWLVEQAVSGFLIMTGNPPDAKRLRASAYTR